MFIILYCRLMSDGGEKIALFLGWNRRLDPLDILVFR